MFDLLILLLLIKFAIVVECHGNYPYDVYLQLQRESDVVVQGRVVQVFSARETPRRRQSNGMPGVDELLKQFNVIQIIVDLVHKQDDDARTSIQPGTVLYAHSWSLFHAPQDCDESIRGQRMLARSGDTVQLFLTRDSVDGSLHAINPNGVELLAAIKS